MSSTTSLPTAASLARRAISVVDTGLQYAAGGAEKVNHALWQTPPKVENEDKVDGVQHSLVARGIEDLRAQIKRGDPFELNLTNIAAITDALFASKIAGGIDDRLYLLETALTFLSRYPPNSLTAKTLQDKVIALLWYDLAHPPASVVGQKYSWRSADGSGTSIWDPGMGKAKSPYARSVQGLHPLPANQLPSAELLFDVLLKREAKVDHPSGLSSFFFAFANLVIHSLFYTNHAEPFSPTNNVSSYLDLSPIYGSSLDEQKTVRLNDGYGRLHPDTFADQRLLRMPPSTPALLVCFARNHNFIVKRLLEINERGVWSDPPTADRKTAQDEELFQTARLINCGWFMSTIFGDYLASILGLVREGNSWSLDPLSEFRADDHQVVGRGCGNVVSIEFLALYHFHSSISAVDEQWVEEAFRRLFEGKALDKITIEDYTKFIRKSGPDNSVPPNEWTFGGLKRDPKTGAFDDGQLAQILQQATLHPAGAFKARGTPHALKVVEMIAIEQNRQWGTCSLNEFRKFLGLKPYSTFEEWNPRKDVADAARRLYHHPDNIELYVGLQAEESKYPAPGAGLCPGYTMSRAILADAVALVRGDRFLTNDFTAFNLTAWGINDCTRNPHNSANGGQMSKMLMRVLPNHYTPDSSYSNFPFMVPSAMKTYLGQVGRADGYNFDPPLAIPAAKAVTTYDDVMSILANPTATSGVPANSKALLDGSGYLSTFNSADLNVAERGLIANAFAPATATKKHFEFLEKMTAQLIKERSYTFAGDKKRSINIVRDVLNLIPIYFISEFVLGLPLKTTENTFGTIFDQEQYIKFREIYDYIFHDEEPSTKVANTPVVKGYCSELEKIVGAHLSGVSTGNIPLVGPAIEKLTTPINAREWLSRLVGLGQAKGRSRTDLANDAVSLAILLSVELSQALTHIVDTFLPPQKPSARPDLSARIRSLVLSPSRDSEADLRQQITNALRARPPIPGVYRSLHPLQGQTSGNDRVYLSFTQAGQDPNVWGASAKPHFPPPQPLFAGGLVNLLGSDWLLNAITPIFKTIFRLNNLERAPGNSGKLLSFMQEVEGIKVESYLDSKQQPTWWSSDLTLSYTE